MYSIDQKLFETYGDAVMREMNCGFDEEELQKWPRKFSIDEEALYRVADGFVDYYYRWASASFGIGLRLGLALLDNGDVCRFCPQEL